MIWLASGSPRRLALLGWAGWEVEAHPADVDERRRAGEAPVAYARRLAHTKVATAPAARLAVAADTVVHLDGEVLDKPRDREEASSHLARLSGGWHEVTTGWCVRHGHLERLAHATTRVRFRSLSSAEIAAYVATGEADDKAGAYAIQGTGGVLVAEVQGSWTNVMGLPMEEVLAVLEAFA
ncbi:MAG: septum formation protein Maf [Alphaproteobacteria bacterium]|nr:septum formation protein Maf [Alphaproteobacteria bacterium]